MEIIIGSARIGENGSITGGKDGDQKQTGKDDYRGEVSLQNFYTHKKGWYILRPKNAEHAVNIASAMWNACNNIHIGYNQNERLDIMKHGTKTTVNINCDCSSLVRCCVYEGTGKDVGNFTTANEVAVLEGSGLFNKRIKYTKGMLLYTGDVLVTCTKGHTVIVTRGNKREIIPAVVDALVYPKYTGSSQSIVEALKAVGETDTSKAHREAIAKVNGINGYIGTANENLRLLDLLKKGILKKWNLQ